MPIPDVIDLFLASASASPSKTAIAVHGQTLTYAALEQRVRLFAGAFERAGGSGILIALPQGAEAYAAMLGAGLAGCFYAPLNVDVPIEKLQRIVRLMQPDIIVAEPTMAAQLAPAAPTATTIDPAQALGPPLTGRGRRHEIAYVIFTSGTTGVSKGAVIPRTALDHFVDWLRYSETITPSDRIAQFSNIAFDVSVTDIYGGLCLGATLYPALGRADRMFPARLIAREQLTVWNSTPSVISLMMQAGEVTHELLGSLRLVNTCGEPLLPTHLAALFAALPELVVQNSYGPTETTVTMTELRLDRHNYQPACGTSVAIGNPIPRIAIHLLGGSHPDEGEIVITGPQLALGYWNDPERTAASFKIIQVNGEPERAYFSGDWAERRDGYLFFKERIDLQVKIHGFRLELDEVARAIHDAGFPVTCVLKWRDELAAVIERHPQHAANERALRAALATQLEAHAIPSVIRWIDRIPRSPNDKLDRQAVSAWLDDQERASRALIAAEATTEQAAIERAWAVYDRGDLAQAIELWRGVRQSFPDNLAGWLGGGAACRRAARFDEADELYRAACERFPDSAELFIDFAWNAEERPDIAEAIRRWDSVRTRFPDRALGYIRPGTLLLNLGRLDEADLVLVEAVRRFPDDPEAVTAYGWVAHLRRDWPEALRRWDIAVTNFQHLPEPRRAAAWVLLELTRYSEAMQVLAPALRMFPEDGELAVLNAWLATRRRDIVEAERLWQDMRARFPGREDGWLGHALVLRDVGRLDEADAMLREAAQRFPNHIQIALEYAQTASQRKHWPLAIHRWHNVVASFPQLAAAPIGLSQCLVNSGHLTEAEDVLRAGLARFPDDAEMAAAEAALADQARDWPRAVQLWEGVQSRFPAQPVGHLGLGRTLRDSAQIERSVQVLSDAQREFPDNVDIGIQLALTLSWKREWPAALRLWESLKQRYPGNGAVRTAIAQILDRALRDQAAGHPEAFEIPSAVLNNELDESAHIKSLAELFNRFESLGDTCEFGMVQRMFQADPIGLLRWTTTWPDKLVQALDARLDGVGDPEHTVIEVRGDEYVTVDRRYDMISHTFTPPATEPREQFALEHCQRMQWLRRKLIDDLTGARRLFVYKFNHGITDLQVHSLYASLCAYNPQNALLCVRLEDRGHPSGTLDHIRGRLFIGYIDRFSTVDISVSVWTRLCQGMADALALAQRDKVA